MLGLFRIRRLFSFRSTSELFPDFKMFPPPPEKNSYPFPARICPNTILISKPVPIETFLCSR